MSFGSAIKLLGASTTWASNTDGLCVVNSPIGDYESDDGGLTWFSVVKRLGGSTRQPLDVSELTDALQDLTGRPSVPRCQSVGHVMVGGFKIMSCDLAKGHAGLHRHGDFGWGNFGWGNFGWGNFGWTDAGQAERDAALAKEAEATLDRELGALDAMLADVEQPSVGKVFVDGQEVADITEVEMQFGGVKFPKNLGVRGAFKPKRT